MKLTVMKYYIIMKMVINIPSKLLYCFFLISIILLFREGNGTRLEYSCLENPMDGGIW